MLITNAQNLVVNPSFETYAPCPTGPSELINAANWHDPYLNIVGDTCSTSDLYNACNTFGSFGVDVPVNIMGNQPARTGSGYAGIIIYEGMSLAPGDCNSLGGTGWREYLSGELTSPMSAGQQYCVSFWVSLADTVKWGSNNFGVYLSTTPLAINCGSVGSNSDLSSYGITPQLVYAGAPILNTTGWTKLQWTYTAVGGEQYITLGNFYGNSSTNYVCSNVNAMNPYAYYFVDDVSVVSGVCCDTFVDPVPPLCTTDAPITFNPITPGGTWSSVPVTTGLNSTTGVFNPTTSGAGTFAITYTLSCGGVTNFNVVVAVCSSMQVCVETNGDLSVSGGNGPYTWASWTAGSSTPITNQTQCESCGYSWFGFPLNQCLDGATPVTSCNSPAAWVNFGSGVTITPPGGSDTIRVTDNFGVVTTINGIGSLPSCSMICDATITPAGPFCVNASSINFSAAQTGGTWSGTGITNASLGTFNPATAGIGNHIITYTLACGDVDTETIVVNALDNASFSYTPTNFCLSDPNPSPTLTGVSGGTYTINNSGVINASTGQVNIASSGVGSFTITYNTNGTCPNSQTFNITISATNNATITPAGPFCENASAINLVAASTGGTWTGTGITNSTLGTFNPTTAGPGSHIITYTISGSCGTSDTETIVVNAVDNAAFSYSSSSFCLTDPNPTPTIVGVSGGTFAISGVGVINPSTGEVNISNSGAGSFTITYSTNGACPSSQTFNININNCTFPLPVANFAASQSNICAGLCINFTDLSTSSAVAGITSWAWTFTGSTTATSASQNPTNICYSAAGTYQVVLTVTDANGSDTETKVGYITVSSCTTPTALINVSDTMVCSGNCITVANTSLNGTLWQWSFQNGNPSTSANQHPGTICFDSLGVQEIKLVVSNTYGIDSMSQFINVVQTQYVTTGNDTTIQLGQSVGLNANGVVNGIYTWTPSTDLTCVGCSNPTSTPTETITYTVITADSNGCSSIDNITIYVEFQNVIFVPNIFSPNGDGVNDILYVRGMGVSNLKFFLYDRWGEKVFETTSLDKGWDGTFRGKEMNKAVFVYYLEATFLDGKQVTQKGDITLVK